MPYAITLGVDTATAPLVVAMWNELAVRGVSDDAVRLGYRPHLTLAVFADVTEPARLLAAAGRGAARWCALPVTFASLGAFPGAPGGLFLAPTVTTALLAMHAELLTELPGEAVDPHYRPGHWVPHVTLAKDLTDAAAAVRAVSPLRLPIGAVLDTIEAVRFRPVRILASHRLLAESDQVGSPPHSSRHG